MVVDSSPWWFSRWERNSPRAYVRLEHDHQYSAEAEQKYEKPEEPQEARLETVELVQEVLQSNPSCP